MVSDVLIIGGGVIGLSIARELHRRGVKQITLVERGSIGGEASWAAAGMLAPNIEANATNDFHSFGIDSLALYPDLSVALFEETGIDIELDRSGTIFLSFDDAEAAEIDNSYRIQRPRGVQVERISGDAIRKIEPSISAAAGPGLYYPDDWQVDNRKLIAALRTFADQNGIRIVENAETTELLTEKNAVIGARTTTGDFRAGTTIVATGAWTSLIKIGDVNIPVQVKPIRGQMISFETRPPMLRHVVYSAAGYLVPRSDGRLLVGATVEDVGFEKAVTDDGVESLVLAALEILPDLSPLPVVDHWSGLRPFVADGLPVLGEIPGFDRAYVATAHYRNGILLAPMTARVIVDKIVDGVDSDPLRIFGVGRFEHQATNATAHR